MIPQCLSKFGGGAWATLLTALYALTAAAAPSWCAPMTLPAGDAGISVTVDDATGAYTISAQNPAWTFAGAVPAPASHAVTGAGTDRIGAYREITFDWNGPDGPRTGAIRLYRDRPVVQFAVTAREAAAHWTTAFPAFTAMPSGLHPYSFRDVVFSPHAFAYAQNATPYVLFDDQANTAVLAPASNFFLARMSRTPDGTVQSGLNATVGPLPAGFTQQTLLTFGHGIGATFAAWGRTYTDFVGRKRPAGDADLLLKYFGYWTDNGADYYYNYDPAQGYAGTLVALTDRYKQEGIPLHYLQLDSWWYQKTRTSPGGVVGGPKKANLPVGTWNAYGGTLFYRASPDLFPQGLAAFDAKVGMPLAVHARWIDPTSEYHKNYKISGIAPVDPRWWDETAAYLQQSGVICYEQDWLNEIYNRSPEMSTTLGVGESFTDNMARSAAAHGLSLQYCMELPRYLLNGARYDNLTTTRVSDDRFERRKWDNFLYTSAFADAMGVWPWVDVFMSRETDNLLLATLSAGPVGTGDALGRESKANIMKAIRADGRIVKPDAPLIPTDASYLADARAEHQPLVAWTHTDHPLRTGYVFAFARKGDAATAVIPLSTLGLTSKEAYRYDYDAGVGKVAPADAPYSVDLGPDNHYYGIVAPVGKCGIAFLGDLAQFVSTGKQRIPAMHEEPNGLTVTAALTPSEKSATLSGWSREKPTFNATEGKVDARTYDPDTRRFTVTVSPGRRPRAEILGGDPVHLVTIAITVSSK
jgi:hypothetical protein